MKQHSDPPQDWNNLREKIIGLGERSIQKSYYPELQQQLVKLERFRALLDQSNEAIFLAEVPSGRLIDVNGSACRQLDYPSQKLLTLSLKDIVPPATAKHIHMLLSQPQTIKPEGNMITTILYRSNSEEIPVEMALRLVDFCDTTYAVAVARDITKRKQAEQEKAELEEQLHQAQKMEAIGILAGGIAHDFNNMLTAIIGYTELVLEMLPPDSPVRNDIQGIQKTAERAAPLTHQLLAFARRQATTPRVIDLNELIVNVDKMLRRLIGEDIELVTLPTAANDRVKIDSGQFEQVLINLAINARDAMPGGGKLTIKTANVTLDRDDIRQQPELQPGQHVLLLVSDTGVGMTEDVKNHLFEPFFSTKTREQGSGLGLAVCFGIVKQNGGHIWVDSKPGQGTTFKIYLPCLEEETVPLSPPLTFDKMPRGTETILFVEDDMAIRELTVRLLSALGYTVLHAGNGSEALYLIQEQPDHQLDLLIVDVVMPQIGGVELARRLQVMQPGLKTLFISGYTDNAFSDDNFQKSGYAFLPKPFSTEQLSHQIRKLLDE